jgi:hypothetical protein
MPEVYEGKLDLNPEYNREDNGLYCLGNVNLDDIVFPYLRGNQKIRITIEVLSEKEKDPEETIGISLGRIIQSSKAIDFLGLDPWCVNSGSDRNIQYQLPISKAKEFGLI